MDEMHKNTAPDIAAATAAMEGNDFAAARAHLDRAAAARPDDADISRLLATAHLSEGNFAASLAAIDAGLALKPGDVFFTRMRELVDGYRVYQDGMLEKRRSVYMDYPPVVHLETFAKCNASCCFCPYETLDRIGVRMSDALISKIIDDLTAIPASVPFFIAPQKVNEPFLDKRIFDVFAEIAAKLANASLLINTNAAALDDRNITKLSQVTNVARMWISLNDHRAEQYEAVMKLPFDRTLERLDAIHKAKADGRLSFPVQVGRVADGSPADAEFVDWVTRRYPHFSPDLLARGDWAGQTELETAAPMAIGCQRWFDLSITATGQVALCCMDGRAAHPIGDITETHVLDIYNGAGYRALRESGDSRLDLGTPCNTCSFY